MPATKRCLEIQNVLEGVQNLFLIEDGRKLVQLEFQ